MPARAYAVLCAAVGTLLCASGVFLLAQFLRFHAPGGLGFALFPMGPNGHYFAASADTVCCSPSSAASTGDPSRRRGSSSCGVPWRTWTTSSSST